MEGRGNPHALRDHLPKSWQIRRPKNKSIESGEYDARTGAEEDGTGKEGNVIDRKIETIIVII